MPGEIKPRISKVPSIADVPQLRLYIFKTKYIANCYGIIAKDLKEAVTSFDLEEDIDYIADFPLAKLSIYASPAMRGKVRIFCEE